MKRLLDWLPVVVGIALLSTLAALQWHRIVRGQNDFVALYVGAKLIGTPDLYSQPANQAMIQSILGATMQSVTYTRPPFYAALLKPLTALPYLAAYGLFTALCLASILWFVARFSKECPSLPVYAAFSIPAIAFLPQGQDAPLLLAFLGASILLARTKRDFVAGLVLSLCAIKFHLFLLIPVLLLLKQKYRILAGAACGAGLLFLIGIAAAGTGSTAGYIQTLRNPWINFSADMMPNLHGLTATLKAGAGVEIALSCAVVATFIWMCQRSDNYELLFALALLGGLLVSYHSGIGDDILLLFIFALVINSSQDKPLRIALAAVLSPIPYIVGVPLGVIVPVLLLVVLALGAVSLRDSCAQARPIPA